MLPLLLSTACAGAPSRPLYAGPLMVREVTVDGCLATPVVEQALAEVREIARACGPELDDPEAYPPTSLDSRIVIAAGGTGRLELLDPERAPPALAACLDKGVKEAVFPSCRHGQTVVLLPWPERAPASSCLGPDDFAAAMETIRPRAHACFELALAHTATLQGAVVVDVTVDATGRVRAVALREQTLPDDYGVNCLMKIIRSVRFPACATGGSSRGTLPWVFGTPTSVRQAGTEERP